MSKLIQQFAYTTPQIPEALRQKVLSTLMKNPKITPIEGIFVSEFIISFIRIYIFNLLKTSLEKIHNAYTSQMNENEQGEKSKTSRETILSLINNDLENAKRHFELFEQDRQLKNLKSLRRIAHQLMAAKGPVSETTVYEFQKALTSNSIDKVLLFKSLHEILKNSLILEDVNVILEKTLEPIQLYFFAPGANARMVIQELKHETKPAQIKSQESEE